jgi:hypothetical protein
LAVAVCEGDRAGTRAAVRWWPASLSPGCASAPLLAFVVLAAGLTTNS